MITMEEERWLDNSVKMRAERNWVVGMGKGSEFI